jgi:nitroreductase
MEVAQAIRTKRAVRVFRPDPLPEDVLKAILNAGRRAQSAKNMQPWHFIVVRERERLEALSRLGTYAGHLAGAAAGIAIVTPPWEQRFSIMFDTGQAAAYMQLAAWELGVASCLATIYEPDKARELLGFPTELTLRIAISFGYPLPQDIEARPPARSGRRPFDEVVHWEHW